MKGARMDGARKKERKGGREGEREGERAYLRDHDNAADFLNLIVVGGGDAVDIS